MAGAMAREPADADFAVIAAKPMGGRKPPGGDMSAMDEMGMEGEASELPPGFESAAAEAFPDMDPAGYPALKRLIALCMESGTEGGY